MVAVVHKPINLLAFLLGFLLAFPVLTHADLIVDGHQVVLDHFTESYLDTGCWGATSGETTYSYYPDQQLLLAITYTNTAGGSCDSSYPQFSDYRLVNFYTVLDGEPSSCHDGFFTAGEVGIDCGGECSNTCDSSICENQSAILSDGLCSEHTSPDAFGNCPSGTTLIFTDVANVCATSPVPAIQYFSGDLQDPSGDVVDDGFFAGVDFPLSGVDDPFESGQISFVQDPEIVIDNGDGTETATVKKYTKRMNPKTGLWETISTGSASVSRTVNSPSGTGFVSGSSGAGIAPGFSGEVEDEIPMEATPLIAAPDGLDFGDKLTDLLNSSSAEFESYVDDVQGSDLVQHFTDVFTLPDDPGDSPLTISMGAYGVHLVDSQMMDTTLSLVGQVLVVCAFIAGAYIVFRKQ